MGNIRLPLKVKLICGMISGEEELFNIVTEELSKQWGEVDLKSDIMIFKQTDYYSKEMGENLKRLFITFSDLIAPEYIVDAKLFTQEIENKYSCNNKRQINLDPGYITEAKLILATTKDNQHRIYMNRGIYTEITLRFKGTTYCPWEWTYSDYKTSEYIDFFIKVRNIYRSQLGRKILKGGTENYSD